VGEIDMSVTSRFEPFDRESVFYDSGTWEALFCEALKDKPDLADRIAGCSSEWSENWRTPNQGDSGSPIRSSLDSNVYICSPTHTGFHFRASFTTWRFAGTW
jgi:hypothetical protein